MDTDTIKIMLKAALSKSESSLVAYFFLIGWMQSAFKEDQEIVSLLEGLKKLKF